MPSNVTHNGALRLLLVDDHDLFRQSVSRLLALESDFLVVGDYDGLDEALAALRHTAVDIVLLDFDLGGAPSTAAITAIRQLEPTMKVLVVTAGMTATESAAALRRGAAGIFLKRRSAATLAQAIRLVATGAIWMDEQIVQKMAAQTSEPGSVGDTPSLTEREHHVLEAVFEGLGDKEIGTRLGISESAVKATLQRLFRKTQVRTRSQLVRVALERSFTLKS